MPRCLTPSALETAGRLRDTKRINPVQRGNELLEHAANQARTATTKGRGMIRVIIAADVDHQRAAGQVRHFETWRQYRV